MEAVAVLSLFADWQARRQYRTFVFNRVRLALAPLETRGVNRLLKSYKHLPEAIDDYRTKGESVETAAVGTVCVILTNVIETTLSAERRAEVLVRIRQRAEEMTHAEVLLPASDDLIVQMVFNLEDRVHKWVLVGLVRPTDTQILMDEILGALAGEPRSERVANRLMRPLVESILSAEHSRIPSEPASEGQRKVDDREAT